jgi:DNA-binding transcriptional MerR regulator
MATAPPTTEPLDAPAAVAYTIAEAARETGLSADALRYYEREGLLLQPVDRAAAGHRRYTDVDLYWIGLVTKLRGTGMPIRTVREYAALVRAGAHTEPARLRLLEDHRIRVLEELETTRSNLRAIEHKIEIYRERAGLGAPERSIAP